jgi:hypothetical protein
MGSIAESGEFVSVVLKIAGLISSRDHDQHSFLFRVIENSVNETEEPTGTRFCKTAAEAHVCNVCIMIRRPKHTTEDLSERSNSVGTQHLYANQRRS